MNFFQSFRNSLLPKQLLRFVLARLDILDSQALDLDNLNFAIGRNTVLEFRDVGLILSKLEAIVKLPPTFNIQKAKVLLLRITIPVDIYNSPISVEVEGVDFRLRVASKQEQDEETARRKGTHQDGEEVVPTAADLAQSFLQTAVPTDEQRRLEKALAEEAQEALSESTSDSETDEDGSFATFGTGQGLSLPTFLTNFLQGIIDRMQIRIHNVTFQLDMQVPVEPGLSTTELVTFQLALDEVIAEGVTAPGQHGDGSPAIVPREGKRHILLDNLRAFLITEANVFSSLLPTQSAHSLVKSQGSASHDAPPTLRDMSRSMQSSVGGLDMSISPDQMEAMDMLAQSHCEVQDSEDALNIPYEDDTRDQEAEENVDGSSPLSTPRASIYQDHDAPILQDHANSAVMQHQPELWSSYERGIRSEPSLQPPPSFKPPTMPSGAVSPAPSEPSSSASSVRSDDDLPSADAEDLAQSHLYSHEEAESMYMSAFSDARSTMMPGSNMPGGWESSSSGGDSASEQEPSATSLQVADEPQPLPTDSPEPAGPQLISDSIPGDEPHHGDASTPRGITRMVKEIVSLDSISVYVPSTRKQQVPVPATNLAKSNPNIPGAFSVHQSMHNTAMEQSKLLTPEDPEEEGRRDDGIEIILKPLTLRFDSSVGFLLAMAVTRLLEAFQVPSDEPTKAEPSKDDSSMPDIKVMLEQVTVQFLEKLAGVADFAKRIYETQRPDFGSDVLLEASLTNLNASAQKSGSQTEVNVSIEKLHFGYTDEAIISFTGEVDLTQSRSTLDMLASGQDIAVKATMTPDVTRVDVKTLPLYVKLDLQRLDETFSWFGGLSSFLNMGSSEASEAKAVQQPAKPPPKTRGVRFEAPIDPREQPSSKESKFDLRINAVYVDLIGKDCSAVLNTTALKLVHREGGTAVHFSKIKLSGPHLRTSLAKPPVLLEVTNTRLDYVLTPRTKDLERLLELITPSKVKFDEDEDEIMVDTLLRQRRKGAVLELKVGLVKMNAGNLALLDCVPSLVEDLAKLGTVAKYLPEDDRPGLLTLGQVTDVVCEVDIGGRIGVINARLSNLELAQITVPSLVAVAVGGITVNRNEKDDAKKEELVSTSAVHAPGMSKPPVLMMRMIDDIEPVLKLKLFGLNVDYRVPTIMDVLGLAQEDTTPEEFDAHLAASVANLGGQATAALRRQDTPESPVVEKEFKPIKLDVAFRDCVIGLNPLGIHSKLAIVLADSHLEAIPGKDSTLDATATLKKACILLIDDARTLQDAQINARGRAPAMSTPQALDLCSKGFVSICEISSAKAVVKVGKDDDGESHLEVSVRDDLLVLETCADSTQTLISLANALTPPTPPSKEIKYRTSVLPVEDLFASITHDAFGRAEGEYDFDNDFAGAQGVDYGNEEDDDYYGIGSMEHLEVQSEGYGVAEELFDATNSSILGDVEVQKTNDGMLVSTAGLDEPPASQSESDLDIQENYFSSEPVKNTTLRWNSRKNLYDQSSDVKATKSPLVICVRDVHVIWNLYDGYDWVRTREIITKAVQDVEAKAYERKARAERHTYEDEGDEASVVDDCLFNSIYIAVGPNGDPSNLRRAINQELQYQDTTTETESIATTAFTTSTARASGHRHSRPRAKTLKLSRSKNHKITFELKGVNIDVVTFPPGNETINTIDVRIHDLVVFDHIRTSTWKKFAMYDIDAGERELSKHMVHLEVLNVKPVPDLPATELVVKVNILPLRLHVDQDALDFITRFFEFKDESQPIHQSTSDVPFIQRCEVGDVPVRLDFKPKRVDYAGLRSGHTTEFMNFVILEDSRLVLRHVILYGVSGFDVLGKKLNDIWTADVKATQLPGVLAGVAPVRSLVNAGSGFKDLIEIPIREYKKDGRIFRSIGKGATAFAKTTGTEVVKLGAKLAIGTQYALQGAEGMLAKSSPTGHYGPHHAHPGPSSSSAVSPSGVDFDTLDEEDFGEDRIPKAISLYADQPLGIMQGMRGAYASLSRDIAIARDAIIAVPTEVMESSSAQGAAKAVLMQAPTILFRPAIGVSKAIGQTLLGATNALDPNHRMRIEAKYKKH